MQGGEDHKKTTENLTQADVIRWLTARGSAQEELFERARQVRHEVGEDSVVLRGVIEISNYCRKNCDYCGMRTANNEINRYIMRADEIIDIAKDIKKTGINCVFLQGGQNPKNDDLLEEVIPAIRNNLGLDVLLCLGERSKKTYERFFHLGATSYILKYETSDSTLYNHITHGQLQRRLQCIEWIREAGMKLGTGNIVGLPGQSIKSLADDILLDKQINPNFVSTSPFIPNNNTPLQHYPVGSYEITLNTIAILRLILKTPLIPSVSALEILSRGGQTAGLNAGANVITINFTPKDLRRLYRIYSEKRYVVSLEHALETIERAGLKVRGIIQ